MVRKSSNGNWKYEFDRPGSTRGNRQREFAGGFTTKGAAKTAEDERRRELKAEAERTATGIGSASRTLGDLMQEFLREHEFKLASTTFERYTNDAKYVSPVLLALPFDKITSPQFTREWNRLRESGGHTREKKIYKPRRSKESFIIIPSKPRPMAAKTVKNIKGLVSSVYAYAISTLGIATANPVTYSKAPKGGSKRQIALTPETTNIIVNAKLMRKDNTPRQRHWILPDILTTNNGLGCRRGETLAFFWTDLVGDMLTIQRSLAQTKLYGLELKDTKTEASFRTISVPPEIMAVLNRLRKQQAIWKAQYGTDYHRQFVNPDGSVHDIDLIFCNPDGSPLKPDTISGLVGKYFTKLEMPKGVSLHTLRHTHGSQMLADGDVSLPAVSKRLGHANPAVTAQIYSHALPEDDRKAMEIWQKKQVGYASA